MDDTPTTELAGADATQVGRPGSDLKVRDRTGEVFTAFLRQGLTAFGGPVAHLGYFRREFVERRGWVSEAAFGDLLALCQFLPGPASSQLGMALGMRRAGLVGGLAAWVGFTLPAATAMVILAYVSPSASGA